MGKISQEAIESFQNAIRQNYEIEGRNFPWRETRNPYNILVSEIMLQQTQTERVVPRYKRWLEIFPDAGTLAESSFADVLGEWVGLGYNRRARFLQETCKLIIADYNGVFPEDPSVLRTFPGIGPYTACAVSTFAFGIPNVFIETNIRTVFIYFFFKDAEVVSDSEILELIGETLWHDDPRAWYYALMDYGSVLKKKIGNPNRKSKHYMRQSAFEGSIRQARGAIIRHLSTFGGSRIDSIANNDKVDEYRLKTALKALLDEGLVCESNGVYSIPASINSKSIDTDRSILI